MLFRKNKKNELSDICPNEFINYNKNDLLDELHERFFMSYAKTLDTADYVPQSYIDKVYKQIYKAQKAMYKLIGKRNKEYQKWFKERLPQMIAERIREQQQDGISNEQEPE